LKHPIATFAGSAASPLEFPRDQLPEVAFLGRSNVGKSSLLNALAGRHALARVSSDPGRTRAVNFFRVSGVTRPGGRSGELYLVDLPGYGYAKAPRQVREGFEGLAVSYLVGREPLRLCVVILDVRREPSRDDLVLRDFLLHHRLAFVVAVNKLDAVSHGEARRRLRKLEQGIGRSARALVATSAERGTGVDALWRLVRAAAFSETSHSPQRARTGNPDPPHATTIDPHAR
jgi:GTP-binding protein